MSIHWDTVFSYPWWVYATIPLGAGLVGWATKILALKMMFYPVEFKGIKPYLGWQGQIPKRAPKMAAVAVDSLTSGILNPDEMFDKIDVDELVKELGEPLHEAAAELVDTVMMTLQPQNLARHTRSGQGPDCCQCGQTHPRCVAQHVRGVTGSGRPDLRHQAHGRHQSGAR